MLSAKHHNPQNPFQDLEQLRNEVVAIQGAASRSESQNAIIAMANLLPEEARSLGHEAIFH